MPAAQVVCLYFKFIVNAAQRMSPTFQEHTLMGKASPEAIAQAALAQGCKSVAYTYNDPVYSMSMPSILHKHAEAWG